MQFIDLLDKNQPMKRIMRTMRMTNEEVTHHLMFLRYYRRFVEVSKELKTPLAFKLTNEQRQELRDKQVDLRRELKELYRECESEVQRISNKLGR